MMMRSTIINGHYYNCYNYIIAKGATVRFGLLICSVFPHTLDCARSIRGARWTSYISQTKEEEQQKEEEQEEEINSYESTSTYTFSL